MLQKQPEFFERLKEAESKAVSIFSSKPIDLKDLRDQCELFFAQLKKDNEQTQNTAELESKVVTVLDEMEAALDQVERKLEAINKSIKTDSSRLRTHKEREVEPIYTYHCDYHGKVKDVYAAVDPSNETNKLTPLETKLQQLLNSPISQTCSPSTGTNKRCADVQQRLSQMRQSTEKRLVWIERCVKLLKDQVDCSSDATEFFDQIQSEFDHAKTEKAQSLEDAAKILRDLKNRLKSKGVSKSSALYEGIVCIKTALERLEDDRINFSFQTEILDRDFAYHEARVEELQNSIEKLWLELRGIIEKEESLREEIDEVTTELSSIHDGVIEWISQVSYSYEFADFSTDKNNRLTALMNQMKTQQQRAESIHGTTEGFACVGQDLLNALSKLDDQLSLVRQSVMQASQLREQRLKELQQMKLALEKCSKALEWNKTRTKQLFPSHTQSGNRKQDPVSNDDVELSNFIDEAEYVRAKLTQHVSGPTKQQLAIKGSDLIRSTEALMMIVNNSETAKHHPGYLDYINNISEYLNNLMDEQTKYRTQRAALELLLSKWRQFENELRVICARVDELTEKPTPVVDLFIDSGQSARCEILAELEQMHETRVPECQKQLHSIFQLREAAAAANEEAPYSDDTQLNKKIDEAARKAETVKQNLSRLLKNYRKLVGEENQLSESLTNLKQRVQQFGQQVIDLESLVSEMTPSQDSSSASETKSKINDALTKGRQLETGQMNTMKQIGELSSSMGNETAGSAFTKQLQYLTHQLQEISSSRLSPVLERLTKIMKGFDEHESRLNHVQTKLSDLENQLQRLLEEDQGRCHQLNDIVEKHEAFNVQKCVDLLTRIDNFKSTDLKEFERHEELLLPLMSNSPSQSNQLKDRFTQLRSKTAGHLAENRKRNLSFHKLGELYGTLKQRQNQETQDIDSAFREIRIERGQTEPTPSKFCKQFSTQLQKSVGRLSRNQSDRHGDLNELWDQIKLQEDEGSFQGVVTSSQAKQPTVPTERQSLITELEQLIHTTKDLGSDWDTYECSLQKYDTQKAEPLSPTGPRMSQNLSDQFATMQIPSELEMKDQIEQNSIRLNELVSREKLMIESCTAAHKSLQQGVVTRDDLMNRLNQAVREYSEFESEHCSSSNKHSTTAESVAQEAERAVETVRLLYENLFNQSASLITEKESKLAHIRRFVRSVRDLDNWQVELYQIVSQYPNADKADLLTSTPHQGKLKFLLENGKVNLRTIQDWAKRVCESDSRPNEITTDEINYQVNRAKRMVDGASGLLEQIERKELEMKKAHADADKEVSYLRLWLDNWNEQLTRLKAKASKISIMTSTSEEAMVNEDEISKVSHEVDDLRNELLNVKQRKIEPIMRDNLIGNVSAQFAFLNTELTEHLSGVNEFGERLDQVKNKLSTFSTVLRNARGWIVNTFQQLRNIREGRVSCLC